LLDNGWATSVLERLTHLKSDIAPSPKVPISDIPSRDEIQTFHALDFFFLLYAMGSALRAPATIVVSQLIIEREPAAVAVSPGLDSRLI
jgi:hypothetical protein